jgi:hypothetical protein
VPTGRKVTQTLQNISKLNVKNLASLNDQEWFLARKATVKLPRAKELGIQDTVEGSD